MNPILKAVYYILRAFAIWGLKMYYPNSEIVNKERLKIKGPGIIATNHPNTIMDPFNSVSRVPRLTFFLANAGLFKTPFTNWLFSTFFCIPIQRAVDTNGGPINNEGALKKIDEFLGNGGIIYMAPEGGSFEGRVMKRLKTGVGRIGLSAERSKNFQLGVKVLPVGLVYSNPSKSGSSLLVNVGEPIIVKDYESEFKDDPFQAAKTITQKLKHVFSNLTIDPIDDEEDALIHKVQDLQHNTLQQSLSKQFEFTKARIQGMRSLKEKDPNQFNSFKTRLEGYHRELSELGLKDKGVLQRAQKSFNWTQQLITIILGFPFFLWGWINNLIGVGIPRLVWKYWKLYPTYEATVKFMLGAVTVPLSYWGQSKLVLHYFGWETTLLYLLTLIPTGLWARKYTSIWRTFVHYQKVVDYQKRDQQGFESIFEKRQDIWNQIYYMK